MSKTILDNTSEYMHLGARNTCKHIRLYIRGIVVVDFLLFILTLIVAYFLKLEKDREDLIDTRPLSELTIFCDDVSLSLDEDYDTFDSNKHDVQVYADDQKRHVCVFKNLTEVIAKATERQLRLLQSQGPEARYIECGNVKFAPKSGDSLFFFYDIVQLQHFSDDGLPPVIHWDTTHEARHHLAPDMTYHNGVVRVTQGQIYFVYATVLLNTSRLLSQHGQRICTISLRICKGNPDFPQTVVEKSQTFVSSEGDGVTSLHIGTHTFLSEGERVFVKVSHPQRILRVVPGNNFGLLPLP